MTVAFWIKLGRKMVQVQVQEDRYNDEKGKFRFMQFPFCFQAKKLLKIIQQRSDIETKSMFSMQEIKELSEQVGIEKDKVYNIVQGLNLQGYLLNKGENIYKLITANV